MAAAQPAGAAPLWRMFVAQASIELRLALRRGESVLITLVVPVLLFVFFAAVVPLPSLSGGAPASPGAPGAPGSPPAAAALLPGMLALAIMSTAMVSLGIATAFERQYGVLKRLGGTPLPRPVLLAAKLASVIGIEAVQVVLLAGFAWGFGWRPADDAALALTLGALALGTAAFGGLGLWMAGSWRAEAALAGANGLYLVLLLLGGIFVPVGRLPGPLAALATLLPSAALADVLRHALVPGSAPLLPPLVVLGIWAAGAPLLAARTFRWE